MQTIGLANHGFRNARMEGEESKDGGFGIGGGVDCIAAVCDPGLLLLALLKLVSSLNSYLLMTTAMLTHSHI